MSNSSLKVVFLEKLMREMKDRLGNKIQTFANEISRAVVVIYWLALPPTKQAHPSLIPRPSSHLILHDFLYIKWVNLF